ncbi:MAG: branched-chain amino acid ABC transporter permease [bacterium]
MDISSHILQYVFTGITLGSIYAMMALGFNIIYNATDIINFAQGEFAMLGGMMMVFFANMVGLPLYISFPLTVIIVTAVGLVFERLAINPLKGAPVITLIIITVGVSILFKGVAMTLWGKDFYSLKPFSGNEPIKVFGATILPQTLWILGITVLVVIALNVFFGRTITGKAMRACAINRKAASLVGINTRTMVLLSFALSAAIGSIAGVVITPISLVEYQRGTLFGLKGFCAAVLGGMGNFTGAILAGFILGVVESLAAGFISSGYKDAYAFVVLLLVLFIRPSGLLGVSHVERV